MKKEYKLTEKEFKVLDAIWDEGGTLAELEKEITKVFLVQRERLKKKRNVWWIKQAEKYNLTPTEYTWTVSPTYKTIYLKKGASE